MLSLCKVYDIIISNHILFENEFNQLHIDFPQCVYIRLYVILYDIATDFYHENLNKTQRQSKIKYN